MVTPNFLLISTAPAQICLPRIIKNCEKYLCIRRHRPQMYFLPYVISTFLQGWNVSKVHTVKDTWLMLTLLYYGDLGWVPQHPIKVRERPSNFSGHLKLPEGACHLAKIFGWKLRKHSMSNRKAFFSRCKLATSLVGQKPYNRWWCNHGTRTQQNGNRKWDGKRGVPLKVVRFFLKIPFDPRLPFTFQPVELKILAKRKLRP